MITLLTGENSFAIEQELRRISAGFHGEPERVDGATIELGQLPDLLMGLSLFAEKRLVIIRQLSSNKLVWEALPELLERINEEIHLVLVEPAVDKRLKTYKTLQKIADSKDSPLLTERDSVAAERWVKEEADRHGMKLNTATIQSLLRRSLVLPERGQPVIDQWYVFHTLEKLSVFEHVTVATVEQYIDEQSVDSVFSIFETALRGDADELQRLLLSAALREDPFRVFGLLSNQVFQLAALTFSDQSTPDTAKAIGVHPYAASKMAGFSKKLSRQQVRHIVQAFADADKALKLSKADPWTLIELALVKTAREVRI